MSVGCETTDRRKASNKGWLTESSTNQVVLSSILIDPEARAGHRNLQGGPAA